MSFQTLTIVPKSIVTTQNSPVDVVFETSYSYVFSTGYIVLLQLH